MIFLFLKIDLISYKKYIKILFLPFKFFFSYISHVRTLPHTYLMHYPQCMKEMYRYMMKCKRGTYIIQKYVQHQVSPTPRSFSVSSLQLSSHHSNGSSLQDIVGRPIFLSFQLSSSPVSPSLGVSSSYYYIHYSKLISAILLSWNFFIMNAQEF